MRQSFLNHALKFIHVHVIVLNEKNKIVVIRIRTAIQFTQGNAVRVGDEDFQIPKLTNANDASFAALRQGNNFTSGTGSASMSNSSAMRRMV